MSKNRNGITTKPTHVIYQVFGEGDKARWQRIGAGWMNQDAKGMNLAFDSLPISGRVVAREAKAEQGGAA